MPVMHLCPAGQDELRKHGNIKEMGSYENIFLNSQEPLCYLVSCAHLYKQMSETELQERSSGALYTERTILVLDQMCWCLRDSWDIPTVQGLRKKNTVY